MSARDLAATARAWATADPHTNTSPDDLLIALADALEVLERQTADALAALVKQAEDAQARTVGLEGLLDGANADALREYKARVRAEEALRQIANMTRDGEYLHPKKIARDALAAAGADTETDG